MATLTVERNGERKDYNITQQQAEQLTEFKYNNAFSGDTEINGIKKSEMVAIIFDKKPEQPFYYTVRLAYNDKGQDITIPKDELPQVMWGFQRKAQVVCSGGAFKGDAIISILPDYNKILGFNKGYDLESEDFRLIANDKTCNQARNYIEGVKKLCGESQTFQELIGKLNTLLLN
jgi:hypothetical protein